MSLAPFPPSFPMSLLGNNLHAGSASPLPALHAARDRDLARTQARRDPKQVHAEGDARAVGDRKEEEAPPRDGRHQPEPKEAPPGEGLSVTDPPPAPDAPPAHADTARVLYRHLDVRA